MQRIATGAGMRICLVSHDTAPTVSSVSSDEAGLPCHLAAAGYDVTLVHRYRDAPPPIRGVRLIGMATSGDHPEPDVAATVATIVAEHAVEPFDVLHACRGYLAGWATLVAARRLGLPYVVSVDHGEVRHDGMRRVLAGAAALLVDSADLATQVWERSGIALDRFVVVPCAVDTNRFTPAIGRVVGKPVRLLYHGRIDRHAAVPELLAALSAVPGDWRCTVVGAGPDLEATWVAAAAYDLADRLCIMDEVGREMLPDLYRTHDILVAAEPAGGRSPAVLRAMASGQVVLFRHPTNTLRDGNGLSVAVDDLPALSLALGRLVADPALRTRMAAATLVECRRTHGWPAVAGQVAAIYARMRDALPRTLPEATAPA